MEELLACTVERLEGVTAGVLKHELPKIIRSENRETGEGSSIGSNECMPRQIRLL